MSMELIEYPDREMLASRAPVTDVLRAQHGAGIEEENFRRIHRARRTKWMQSNQCL